MKALIFMNDEIRKAKPRKPVIRVQLEDGRYLDTNRIMFRGHATVQFSQAGCPEIETHAVRAWVETDERNLLVPILQEWKQS